MSALMLVWECFLTDLSSISMTRVVLSSRCLNAHMERSSTETYELSPDGRKSIEFYRSLEQAIDRATVLLSSRVDVQQFRIYASAGFGRRLVGSVSRDKEYRPAS